MAAPNVRWLGRVFLVAAAAFGIWIWRGGLGLVPSEREVVFQLQGDRARLEAVEVQILDAKGDILKRDERFFPVGTAPLEIVEEVALTRGTFDARVFLKEQGQEVQSKRTQFQVGDEETIFVPIR